jgi:hypothetical protein
MFRAFYLVEVGVVCELVAGRTPVISGCWEPLKWVRVEKISTLVFYLDFFMAVCPHSGEPPLLRRAQAAMSVSRSTCWDDQICCALCCVALA